MAEANGIDKYEDTVQVSISHLGKRKRTLSPDPTNSPAKDRNAPLQTALQDVLRVLRKCVSFALLPSYPANAVI